MGNEHILTVGLLCTLYALSFLIFKNAIGRQRKRWISRIAKFESKAKELKDEFDKLDAIDREVKARELLSVGLYDFTKKMSHCLRFDEIASVLESFLKESLKDKFTFKKGELIVVKESGGSYIVDRRYELSGSVDAAPSGPRLPVRESSYDFEKLLELSLADKKGRFIEAREDSNLFRALKVSKDTENLSVVPIMHEKSLAAILTMEDMQRRNLEMLGIISIQLALEMKKVFLYEMVEYLSIRDGLTGLYGRRYFLERLGEELKRSKGHGLTFSFLMADIDHFKVTNDTYGHLVGDVILKEIARMIKESLREIDLVARYGGEEFSAILPETKKDDGARVAERIRSRIENDLFRAYDETLKITISIGVSAYPDDGGEIDAIIDSADKAVYKAKSDGRNLVRRIL